MHEESNRLIIELICELTHFRELYLNLSYKAEMVLKPCNCVVTQNKIMMIIMYKHLLWPSVKKLLC